MVRGEKLGSLTSELDFFRSTEFLADIETRIVRERTEGRRLIIRALGIGARSRNMHESATEYTEKRN